MKNEEQPALPPEMSEEEYKAMGEYWTYQVAMGLVSFLRWLQGATHPSGEVWLHVNDKPNRHARRAAIRTGRLKL